MCNPLSSIEKNLDLPGNAQLVDKVIIAMPLSLFPIQTYRPNHTSQDN